MDEALRSTDLGSMVNCFGLEPEVTQEDEVSFFGSTIKNGHREYRIWLYSAFKL